MDDAAIAALDTIDSIAEPTAEDHFDRAELVRLNQLENNLADCPRELINDITVDYRRALETWRPEENPAFMLNRIGDTERQLMDIYGDDDYIMRAVVDLANNPYKQTIRNANAEQRYNLAAQNASSPAQAAENFMAVSQTYTNDAQNVHDSSVNRDLNNTLRELRSTLPTGYSTTSAISDARKYCNGTYRREYGDAKADRAQRCLDIITTGNHITTFNDTEDEIFAATWLRCDHRANQRNKKDMRDGIIHALADSIEGANPVCIGGRCGRVLSSLVTLDYNTEVGVAMTAEAYRNQIFHETADLIRETIDTAKQSNDVDLATAANAYDDSGDAPDRGNDKLREMMLHAIDNNINSYRDKVGQADLETIQRDARLGIGL